MTLSVLLLILLPLFLLPAFLLSKNRLQFYLLCSFPSALGIILLLIIDFSFPSYQINQKIGTAFLPLWNWLFQGYKELNSAEIIHLSCCFSYLLLYFILYLICYLFVKKFYIGSNPNIHGYINLLTRFFSIILFFLTTYGICFLFLIEIREILPFPDGFLSFLFNWFYQIEV